MPFDLKYTPAVPAARIIVHAGKLVDMKSPTARTNVDIVITGNRITSVVPHADGNHAGQVVDASSETVMPGLVEFHSHLQKDYGEAQGALAGLRHHHDQEPGNTPRASRIARRRGGRRPGPASADHYLMGSSGSTKMDRDLERRAIRDGIAARKCLQHDLIKTTCGCGSQQKRMVEFAHSIGVPVASHEIYPAAFIGADNTEHTGATSRRGYSPKIATLQRSYEDVIQLFGKSGRILCPMISGGGARRLFETEPELKNDPRFRLYPEWIQRQVAAQPNTGNPGGGGDPAGGSGKMVMDAMRAGALIVAGTDTPNAINLHGELMAYTQAGMTPYEALKAATVNPAQALGLDAGTIDAGKLADLVFVDGDPLVNIANAHKVRRVIANGRLYELSDLVRASAARTNSAGW